MSRQLRVTVVVDNTLFRTDLLSEHGVSFWIEAGDQRILFDTGQGPALQLNAKSLGIELATANAIALSHGHYDHGGGLANAWTATERRPLYLHAAALATRYRDAKMIGLPQPVRELVEQHMDAVRFSDRPTEIAPGVWLTGYLPRRHPEEAAEPEPFFFDSAGQQHDPLLDDQALYFVTNTGVIVLLGCAHAGVINTLEYVSELTGGAPLRLVIGGLHLRAVSKQRLTWTVAKLQLLNPQLLVPAHCTGEPATAALAATFGERCRTCLSGNSPETGTLLIILNKINSMGMGVDSREIKVLHR